jgi:hypothetical protein
MVSSPVEAGKGVEEAGCPTAESTGAGGAVKQERVEGGKPVREICNFSHPPAGKVAGPLLRKPPGGTLNGR